MAFLQELADLKLEPKSEAEIDALMTAAAPAPAPAPDASSSDDDGAVEVRASSDDGDFAGRPALAGDVRAGHALHARGREPVPLEARDGARRAAGAASFTKREGGGDPAETYRAASLRWEYDAAQLRASVERGDGEWCMALYDAYEGWRAGARRERLRARGRPRGALDASRGRGDGAGVVDGAPGLRRLRQGRRRRREAIGSCEGRARRCCSAGPDGVPRGAQRGFE